MPYQPGAIADPTMNTDGQRSLPGLVSERVVLQVEDKILFRRPNASPVITFSKGVRGSKSVPNRKFGWLTKDEYPRFSSVADATVAADGVTLNVPTGEGSRFYKYALVLNASTREVFRVSSVATDELTITRPCNGQVMTQGEVLVILGSAFKSGSGKGDLKSIKEVYADNYTEIVRTAWGYDRRQKHTDLYGGRDPKTEKDWQTTKHAMDMEYIALFGRKSLTVDSGQEITTTMGLEQAIEPYSVWDLENSRPTFNELNRVLEFAMAEGDGGYVQNKGDATKYLIHSPAWGTLFDEWWQDKIRYDTDDKGLGLKIGFAESSHGRLGLMKHPLLVGPHAGWAFLLDFNHIEFRYHEGGNTELRQNIQANDVDGEEHEYLTDFGLRIDAAFRQHTIFKNLGAAA